MAKKRTSSVEQGPEAQDVNSTSGDALVGNTLQSAEASSPYHSNGTTAESGEKLFHRLNRWFQDPNNCTKVPHFRGKELKDRTLQAQQVIASLSSSKKKSKLLPTDAIFDLGWVPSRFLVLCLQESDIPSATLQELRHASRELQLIVTVKNALIAWKLQEEFLQVAAARGNNRQTVYQTSDAQLLRLCYHCELFVARVASCCEIFQLKKPPKSLMVKVKQCLSILNENVKACQDNLEEVQGLLAQQKAAKERKKKRKAAEEQVMQKENKESSSNKRLKIQQEETTSTPHQQMKMHSSLTPLVTVPAQAAKMTTTSTPTTAAVDPVMIHTVTPMVAATPAQFTSIREEGAEDEASSLSVPSAFESSAGCSPPSSTSETSSNIMNSNSESPAYLSPNLARSISDKTYSSLRSVYRTCAKHLAGALRDMAARLYPEEERMDTSK